MNVYVRELVTSLAHRGVRCDVYTRRTSPEQPDEVLVEPGFRLFHLDAGAHDLPKERLPGILDEFTARLGEALARSPVEAIHAHYWLSAEVGHRLKHELDLPLVVTFHTLARVKEANGDPESAERLISEDRTMSCADAVLASCGEEAAQLRRYYDLDPSRVAMVAPGVDHAIFSPGQRWAARRALGLPEGPLALFVGRIQPLKGLDVAVGALARSRHRNLQMAVVGGPSGVEGFDHLLEVRKLAAETGVADRIHWFDPQPHHLLSGFYRAADVCLVPSRSESFGLVALEASACGTPVVATEVGGLIDLVDHALTGYLAHERTAETFGAHLDSLVGNELMAMAMGGAAAAKATAYTWSRAAADLSRVLERITSRAPVSCV